MLMTVTAGSVPNNLHYIHKKCNTIKSNKNILEVFNQIGRTDGEFKCTEDKTETCKKLFVNILNSIKFREPSEIQYRLTNIEPFNKEVRSLIYKFEIMFNDVIEAAKVLTKMKNRPASAPALAKGKKLTQRKKCYAT